MQERFRCTLYGEPIAQKRARFSSFGGFTRVYDPVAKEKQRVVRELRSGGITNPVLDGTPFELFIMVKRTYPKSTAKCRRIDLAPCITKPDIDNYLKFYLDCIVQAGIVKDDNLCFSIATQKLYTTDDKPSVSIVINTI